MIEFLFTAKVCFYDLSVFTPLAKQVEGMGVLHMSKSHSERGLMGPKLNISWFSNCIWSSKVIFIYSDLPNFNVIHLAISNATPIENMWPDLSGTLQ